MENKITTLNKMIKEISRFRDLFDVFVDFVEIVMR